MTAWRSRRQVPLALLVALPVLLTLLCLNLSEPIDSQARSSLRPRPPVDHSRLAAQVAQAVSASAGTTIFLRVSERELESFVNYDALPRASLGVASIGLRFRPDTAEVALFLGRSTRVARLEVRQVQGPARPRLEVVRACLGPLELPAFVRRLLANIANATLETGETGVVPLSLAIGEGEAWVALNRR